MLSFGIESSVKCLQTSETEYVDVSVKTVELATASGRHHKICKLRTSDVIVHGISVCSKKHDTRATADLGPPRRRRQLWCHLVHCPQAAMYVSHSPPINGQCTECAEHAQTWLLWRCLNALLMWRSLTIHNIWRSDTMRK